MTIEIHRKDGEIEKRPKSAGGKLFDLITYGGFAGLGTFLVTIPVANLFFKGGRFHAANQWIETKLKGMNVSDRMTNHATNTFATFWGGNLMLIPVGIMEYFRTPIVQGFNRMLNDPTDPASIEDAPPQTLMSILKARAIAAATVLVGFVGTETLVGEQRFKDALDRAGHKWANIRGRTPGTVGYEKSYKVGHTSGLDALATASSATLLYIGSHAFANRDAEKRAHRGAAERRREAAAAANGTTPATPEKDVLAQSAASSETPGATISNVQREAPLAAAAQPPVAAL